MMNVWQLCHKTGEKKMKKLTAKKIQNIVARLEKLNPDFKFQVRSEYLGDKNFALCFDHPRADWSGDYCEAKNIDDVMLVGGDGSIPVEITRKDNANGMFQPINDEIDSTIVTIDVINGFISISTRLTECENLFKTFNFKN